jgi:hypothetical protein
VAHPNDTGKEVGFLLKYTFEGSRLSTLSVTKQPFSVSLSSLLDCDLFGKGVIQKVGHEYKGFVL